MPLKGAAHVCALQAIERKCGLGIYNVGTGRGYSVLDMIKAELGWEARFGIEEMVRDSWNWQRQNPDGYPEA